MSLAILLEKKDWCAISCMRQNTRVLVSPQRSVRPQDTGHLKGPL